MSHFQFENPEQLRSEHMSQEEMSEVVKLWSEKQREEATRPPSPTVRDVAESLEIPAEEARALLHEVRERRLIAESTSSVTAPGSIGMLTVVSVVSAAALLISSVSMLPFFAIISAVALILSLLLARRWGWALLTLLLLAGLYRAISPTTGTVGRTPPPVESSGPIPPPPPAAPPAELPR